MIKTFSLTNFTNGFPVFPNDDVELRLSHRAEDRYVLYSKVLINNSSYFEASMSESWAVGEKPEGAIKWRFDLLSIDDTIDDAINDRILIRVSYFMADPSQSELTISATCSFRWTGSP